LFDIKLNSPDLLSRLFSYLICEVSDLEAIRTDLQYVTGQRALPSNSTLGTILKRLDAYSEERELSPQFLHYLSRRSYVKALHWLDHPDSPHEQ